MRQLKVKKSNSVTPVCETTPLRPADFRGGDAFFLRNMPGDYKQDVQNVECFINLFKNEVVFIGELCINLLKRLFDYLKVVLISQKISFIFVGVQKRTLGRLEPPRANILKIKT